MEHLQQLIQNDIATQRANFAKREREAEKAGARIGELRAEFADDAQAALRDYGIGLEMAKMKLGRMTAGLEGTEAGARALEIQALIDEELAKNQNAIEMQARGQYLDAAVAQGGMMTNAAQMREGRAVRTAEMNMAARKASGPALEGYQFTGKTKPTEPTLTKAQKAQELKRSADALINEALALRDKYGSEHGGGPVQSRMDILQTDLITTIGRMSDAGVIQPGERERFEEAVGSLSGVGWVSDRLKALKWLIGTKSDAAARAAGFEPIQRDLPAGAKPFE